ncbi:methyltransferase domain-containing protein [Helicobacter jaachi]|uniref:Methyltransferase domain-containing protein n=1 Tax=Helicobacter jaachi TaxID=1677920 RepID=A0A4U8TBZ7_9HELI|nr:methyltransferase [Helicobacter jaachi]TLD97449.1 methyltransferase domain-containing protein [Helicobacter jaachi]
MAALEIYQLENGYCYNTDSLILAYFARNFLKKHMRILDVGAGSGILGILCAREICNLGGKAELHLVEKDEAMSILARKNAQSFGGMVHCVDFLDFETPSKFDFIITNPPFYTKGALHGQNTRKNLARQSCFLPLHDLLTHIKRVLKPNGVLCMCYDARLCYELFCEFGACGLHIDEVCFVHSLPSRESTLVVLKAKIQSKSPLRILPPIFTHQSSKQSDNTKELKAIYAWAKTKSIKIKTLSALDSIMPLQV